MFSKLAQSVNKYLGVLYQNICCQKPSKIAQSSHTDLNLSDQLWATCQVLTFDFFFYYFFLHTKEDVLILQLLRETFPSSVYLRLLKQPQQSPSQPPRPPRPPLFSEASLDPTLCLHFSKDFLNKFNTSSIFIFFFKNWPTPASFCVFLVFSNKQYNFYNKYMLKNLHPVYGAGIPTHNLQNVSLFPQPLDQGSRNSFSFPVKNVDRSRCAVWPDLANFRHFGTI